MPSVMSLDSRIFFKSFVLLVSVFQVQVLRSFSHYDHDTLLLLYNNSELKGQKYKLHNSKKNPKRLMLAAHRGSPSIFLTFRRRLPVQGSGSCRDFSISHVSGPFLLDAPGFQFPSDRTHPSTSTLVFL